MAPHGIAKRVLLQDIANATGFTVNTVSRALKNKTDISKATCERIQQVAHDMGYVQNSIASSLRLGCSRTLAVIVAGLSNPFYATMVDAIHDLAEAQGYTVLVLCTRDDEVQERQAILTAIGRQVDGILLCPSNQYRKNTTLIRSAGIPYVLVSRHAEADDSDSVLCNEETGGFLACKHLIEAGHRKLGYFYNGEVLYSSAERTKGFLRAAHEAGIPREDIRFFKNTDDSAATRELTRWKEEGVTGIFVFCDIEAWQLLEKLSALGMAKQFALVGFDNIQGILGIPTPLCTVDGAMREVTATALALLLDRVQGDESPARHLVFPAKLVCRGSCQRSQEP